MSTVNVTPLRHESAQARQVAGGTVALCIDLNLLELTVEEKAWLLALVDLFRIGPVTTANSA